MASSFLARSSISLVLALLACRSFGQSFGRFGYESKWDLPALRVDQEGFRVFQPNAAKFKFSPPNASWKAVATHSMSQTVALNGAHVKKARANLASLGFELYCDGPFRLKLSTTSAPYLTWSEGSVGSGVPTAECAWVVVSFKDEQPPIAIGFIGPPAAMQVTGAAGDWTLATVEPRTGWIRISAPTGILPFRTNGAAELGSLKQRIAPIAIDFAAPGPVLKTSELAEDLSGVEWTVGFDRSRFVLPASWMLAPLGGYPVKVGGEPIATPIVTEYGPVYLSSLERLKIRFPTRRIPLGRALAVGGDPLPELGTVSSLHVPGVVELALSCLSSRADQTVRESARTVLEDFFESASYATEPHTLQKLPFDKSGEGLDVVASHALLMQCQQNADAVDATENALLLSLSSRRDWFNGLLWGPASERTRRASAIAALAGAFSPDPSRRLDGALFEAGVSGAQGLVVWRKRRSISTQEPVLIEPMKATRDAVFGKTLGSAFVKSLLGDLRLVGRRSYSMAAKGRTLTLSGSSEDLGAVSMLIHAAYPVEFTAGENIQSMTVDESFGDYRVQARLKAPGAFAIVAKIPDWAPLPPTFVAPPSYSE